MNQHIAGLIFTVSIVIGAVLVDMAETGALNMLWKWVGYFLIIGGMILVGYYFFKDNFPKLIKLFKEFLHLD